MKALKIISSLCLLLCFTSCDSDDSDDSETTAADEQSIIGTWSMIEFEADSEITTDVAGQALTIADVTSVGENFDYTVVFTENTYTVGGSYDIVTTGTGTGILGEETIEDTQSITGIDETGTYTLDTEEGTILFDGNLFDFEANGMEFSEFSEEQELNIAFDNSGNLVLTQVVETIIEEQGLELSATVDARVVFSSN